uniref:serine C-palmitoyltransferase n=1 Tax=Craspedostauros australis TaxID=1486917 RepID=A0A7R9ZNY5_9STRA
MKRRSRLRRLLGFADGSGKASQAALSRLDSDDVPEAEVSSTSSGVASHTSSNGDLGSFFESSTPAEDPYQDVRERMEELAAKDRAMFATHDEPSQLHDLSLPAFAAYTTYLGYAVLIVCGHIRDFFSRFLGGRYSSRSSTFASDNLSLYAPLLKSWENFYTRRLYHRIQDCFNRPIASNPGATIQVLERVSDDGNKTMKLLGTLSDLDNDSQRELYSNGDHFVAVSDDRVARQCINLGSYNYLGFADDWQVTCARDVIASLDDLPVSMSASLNEFGTTTRHRELERLVARFMGKEDALVLNMGFNTNATTIPALVGRGDLLISDELNHTSIVNGARGSGAAIRIFRHNDIDNLENVLREAIIMGRPRTRRPWNKIMVVVEGIYSMEGEYCDLANVVRVCKKYGAYVYLDEAHSVGAMGPTGRGCAEYCGVDTADIDIMMGTFTKSFGGMGGYIAASKDTIAFLRQRCAGSANHNSLSPVVCQQVISSFKVSSESLRAPSQSSHAHLLNAFLAVSPNVFDLLLACFLLHAHRDLILNVFQFPPRPFPSPCLDANLLNFRR